MVETATVRESEACYTSQCDEGRVCVFAGATTGIGLGTLRKMLVIMRSSTFYVLGRSEPCFRGELEKLRTLSPGSKVVFIEVQVSLISGIDAACKQITATESKVDCLCMSPGGMPFQGATLKKAWNYALLYRTTRDCGSCPTFCLCSIVRHSPEFCRSSTAPRRNESIEEDLGLERNWAILAVVDHTTICTSLAFDFLAANDSKKHITFIHATPGFVNTGTPRTTYPTRKDGMLRWAFLCIMQVVSGWIIRCFGMSLSESGERNAFYLTSDKFMPGSWQTNRYNDIIAPNSALKHYRETGYAQQVWDHTGRVWDRALTKSASS